MRGRNQKQKRMSETTEQAVKTPIESILEKNLLDILKYAPQAEMVRARVHAAILRPIPAEAKTFDEIKAWIEGNIIPGLAPVPPAYNPPPVTVTAPAPAPPPAAAAAPLRVDVRYREREFGRCSYDVMCSGVRQCAMSGDEMAAFIREQIDDGADFDDIVNNLEEHLKDMALNDPPTTARDVEPDLDDYESGDESPRFQGCELVSGNFQDQFESYLNDNPAIGDLLRAHLEMEPDDAF
jgi:hypothetical protein